MFLVNLPVCLLVLLVAPSRLPDTRGEKPVALDLPGTVLLSLGLASLLFPLALGPIWHWPLSCVAVLLSSLVWFAWLWRVENRQPAPLLPPALFRLPGIRFGLLLALLFFSSWSGFMFAVAYTLQSGAGFTPLQSGNSFIGLGLSYFVSSLFSGRLLTRLGNRNVLLIGCAIQMSGLALLMASLAWRWPVSVLQLLPATMMIGFGQAFIVSSFYRIGMSDVPTQQAGAGSALLSTMQQASLGLGPIVLGTVLVHVLHASGGHFASALTAALMAEWVVMLVLVLCALRNRPSRPVSQTVACGE
ncbi:hypothetical protein DZS_33880 [Dickeya ananatis]